MADCLGYIIDVCAIRFKAGFFYCVMPFFLILLQFIYMFCIFFMINTIFFLNAVQGSEPLANLVDCITLNVILL